MLAAMALGSSFGLPDGDRLAFGKLGDHPLQLWLEVGFEGNRIVKELCKGSGNPLIVKVDQTRQRTATNSRVGRAKLCSLIRTT